MCDVLTRRAACSDTRAARGAPGSVTLSRVIIQTQCWCQDANMPEIKWLTCLCSACVLCFSIIMTSSEHVLAPDYTFQHRQERRFMLPEDELWSIQQFVCFLSHPKLITGFDVDPWTVRCIGWGQKCRMDSQTDQHHRLKPWSGNVTHFEIRRVYQRKAGIADIKGLAEGP